ncbi:MAG: hypothetical protein LBB45_01190 [Methanobrevibacter sp.]|jgi:hypothetical protein|nr:hypothetical protein [Candidatus Methanovirga basalitermitum]
MKVVTTPMCEKIVEIAGIKDFKVSKNIDEEEGDLAILMSEKKTKMNSLVIKLNTFNQIKNSIFEVYKYNTSINKPNLDDEVNKIFIDNNMYNWIDKNQKKELKELNSNIKVMVYTIFLKEIVEDMGFEILNLNIFDLDIKKHKEIILEDLIAIEESDDLDVDYLIFPDYFEIKISYLTPKIQNKIVLIPTHNNISKNPIERAITRYSILERLIN